MGAILPLARCEDVSGRALKALEASDQGMGSGARLAAVDSHLLSDDGLCVYVLQHCARGRHHCQQHTPHHSPLHPACKIRTHLQVPATSTGDDLWKPRQERDKQLDHSAPSYSL